MLCPHGLFGTTEECGLVVLLACQVHQLNDVTNRKVGNMHALHALQRNQSMATVVTDLALLEKFPPMLHKIKFKQFVP